MSDKKSILTAHAVSAQTPPSLNLPKPYWDVEKFNGLIYNHGYEAYIEKALRCPCVDKATGQAQSTCKNCLGRGWFFVDKRETKIIAQGMDNILRNSNIGQINRGVARITARAVDRLGFMDRIIITELEAYYSEVLRPVLYQEELIAYPIYEPLEVTNIFLYTDDATKLTSLDTTQYKIDGNKIIFDSSLLDLVPVEDVNQKQPELSISIRYTYNPVYHVIDANRELTKVRNKGCTYTDGNLMDIPIYMLAKKAHYIFDSQKFDDDLIDNSEIK